MPCLRIIMTPTGSSGDVHPYIGIGTALRRRGHEVVILTSGAFGQVIEHAGLRFVEVATAGEYHAATREQDLWHPTRGMGLVMRLIAQSMRKQYELIGECYVPGRSVLVGHTTAFGTRVFEEKHSAPAATIHLAPSVFRSDYQVAAHLPGRDMSWMPWWIRRGLWRYIDHILFDRHVVPSLNAWRTELGLRPVSRLFKQWVHSPQRVIGLFPDWFAPPQPDWPKALRLTGFPLFDEEPLHPVDPALEAFLAAGDAPIAATPGSANCQARAFFEAIIDASARLGRRAILLTRYPEQLPKRLPEHVRHFGYVPFSRLLGRCAAVVHHAGIGSCAQGLAAGIPQLAMPMGFDQPDNITRLMRLGVAGFVSPRKLTGRRVAIALKLLLDSGQVAEACRRYARLIHTSDPIGATCDLIEQAARPSCPRSSEMAMAPRGKKRCKST